MRKNFALRVKNLIEEYRTKNPFEICERAGIEILYQDLGEIKGFHVRNVGVSLIIINSKLSELMMIIVLLHELGHAVLKHPTKDISFMKDNFFGYSNQLENEANLFLAEFLFNYIRLEDYCIGKEEERALIRLAELKSRFEKRTKNILHIQ